jgi:hypothetical protein
MSITEHAQAAISAIEQKSDDELLQALGEMDAANNAIRTLVTAIDFHLNNCTDFSLKCGCSLPEGVTDFAI